MELTEVEFWDKYWANCKLPSVVDYHFSFDRCLAEALKENLSDLYGEVLEVGCAPGKWLAFMATEFGLIPNGIEYSQAGMQATIQNFRHLDLTCGRIVTGDFFELDPDRQFDVVMSFGFIEHFSDPDFVVDLHLKWLKPGGVLIIGVPNFQGIYYYLQKILDVEILNKHNLGIMNLDYFRSIANKFSLNTVSVQYIGSFEPSLLVRSRNKNTLAKFFIRAGLWLAGKIRQLKILDRINGKGFSSYILAVYKKSGEN